MNIAGGVASTISASNLFPALASTAKYQVLHCEKKEEDR